MEGAHVRMHAVSGSLYNLSRHVQELSVKGEKREYTPASKDKKAKHKGGKDASAKRKRSQ